MNLIAYIIVGIIILFVITNINKDSEPLTKDNIKHTLIGRSGRNE